MDDFLRSFKSVRDNPQLVASSNKGFPPELHQLAKELVKTSRHKYSVLPIVKIIIANLQRGKSIQDIKEGLVSISKYPLCLYLDQDRPEFHQIRTFSGYYTYELKEKLDSFEQILEALGYRYDAPSQLYKLDDETRASKTFDDTIAKIGCDLVLALEDLDLYIEMSKGNHIDPVVHFSTRVPQLQQNYEPAEIQYSNPAIPPRMPNQQMYATQNPRNDTQNPYSNMPNRFPNSQAMHGAHIPESQHRGVYQGSRMPYTSQDANPVFRAPHPREYQRQEQSYSTNTGYTKSDPYAHNQQTAPNYDTRDYLPQGPVQLPYGQDPISVQAPSYVRQEVNTRPTYDSGYNYNQNPGDPIQPGQDHTRPTNTEYGKSDPFPQAQHTQDNAYANNYNHEYKQPMYGDPDTYAPNTAAIYENTSSYTVEPAYTPDTGYRRAGANTGPVDIRYPQNPISELAEVDAIPPRRPKPNLTQGNKEFPQHPVVPLSNVPTSKSTDQLNMVNLVRDAGNDSSELNRQHLNLYGQPDPLKDTGRDAGITQRGQTYVDPSDTPNKPQDFQSNYSRDADERNTGSQQAAMYRNRNASETPNQTESFVQTQDSTGQTSESVVPRYSDRAYENQTLGIYSSTARGVESPSVQPKNTHDLDERTRNQSGDKSDFKTRAFAKSESSELHEVDEKIISREHKFSGVKEQGSSSPRQQSPKPTNYSGKMETGGLQAANTQQPFQPYGTQYGKLSEEYNPPYQQQPPANPVVYPHEMGDPHRVDMSDSTKGIDNMHMSNRPPDDYQRYNPPERTPAYPGANPIEETRRSMPAPNMPDYSQGVGSTRNSMNKATEAYQGYDNQEYPSANPREMGDPRRTDISDSTKGIDNMHMANRPPDDYQRYNPPERTPAYPGAYPIEETRRSMPAPYSQGVGSTRNPMNNATEAYPRYDNQEYPPANPIEGTRRSMPAPNLPDYSQGVGSTRNPIKTTEAYQGYDNQEYPPANLREMGTHRADFSQRVDSTQHHTRPEQPPTAHPNEPYKQVDDRAYPDPFDLRNPRAKISPKDDFSQAVSDKNTGINDPNPVRNNPPLHYPRHREDPVFSDPHDYRTAHHDDIPYGDDEFMMMEAPEMMRMDIRDREKYLRSKEIKNIADMQRMREHAGYDDPPHHSRQQHMDPTYHRPYEQPFQPPVLPPAPTTEWACPHCTYVNGPGIRVCTICSKTPGSIAEKADVLPTGTITCRMCLKINPSTARLCVDCRRGLFD